MFVDDLSTLLEILPLRISFTILVFEGSSKTYSIIWSEFAIDGEWHLTPLIDKGAQTDMRCKHEIAWSSLNVGMLSSFASAGVLYLTEFLKDYASLHNGSLSVDI